MKHSYLMIMSSISSSDKIWWGDSTMVRHRGHNCVSSALTILDSALTT